MQLVNHSTRMSLFIAAKRTKEDAIEKRIQGFLEKKKGRIWEWDQIEQRFKILFSLLCEPSDSKKNVD